MFRPSPLAAIAVAAAFLAPAPAQAAPFVGRVRLASAPIEVVGTDGNGYVVTVLVEVLEPANDVATSYGAVEIAKCNRGSCSSAKRYELTLRAGDLTIADDLSSASLRTRFAGLAVSASWHGSSTPSAISGHVAVTNDDVMVTEPGGGDVGVVVSVLGASCLGTGDLSAMRVVSADFQPTVGGGRAPTSPPTGFKPVRGRKVRCA